MLILINRILTTSSTFFIGLALILILGLTMNKNKNKNKVILIIIIFLRFFIFLNKIYSQIGKLLMGLFSKIGGNGNSGVERSFNMIHHLKLALKYPFFGIGYGISRSKDLLSSWILNTGFIGVFSFFVAFSISYKRINRYTKSIYFTILIYYIMEFVSVPEPYFIYSWIFFGILDSSLKERKVD